ncbi:hypothetical protein [Billgrantia endophytica]|uniref:Uncharacterized protein n=1 Tax=Billgrantia endophytica TaxID=2033802 RepID=A0A2N7TUE2_9GAMM|nr:hypothetical protein [Halomonas endophytica]PMR71803.1 hypothetical protein C1H69_22990 [Halomonas endophytica]
MLRNIEYKGKIYKNPRELYRHNKPHHSVTINAFEARCRGNWDIDDALDTPKQPKGRRKKPKTKEELTQRLKQVVSKNKPTEAEGAMQGAFREAIGSQQGKAPTEIPKPVEQHRFKPNTALALNKEIHPTEKRVSLYVAKTELSGQHRAVIGFTTEKTPSDLEFLDTEILLIAKVGFTTAGQIQNKIVEVFFSQHNIDESADMASSQVFDFNDGDYFNALDYIYSLISSYQNSQQQA